MGPAVLPADVLLGIGLQSRAESSRQLLSHDLTQQRRGEGGGGGCKNHQKTRTLDKAPSCLLFWSPQIQLGGRPRSDADTGSCRVKWGFVHPSAKNLQLDFEPSLSRRNLGEGAAVGGFPSQKCVSGESS